MNHSRKRESSVRDARQKTSWTIHFLFFVASHFCFLQSVFCCKQAIYFLPLLLIFVSKKFAPKYFCFHKKKKIQDISCSLLQVISVGSNPFFFFAIVVDFCFKKFCTQVFLLSQKNKLTTFCFHKKKKNGFNTTLFPGGPPPQYWAGSNRVNFGVRMRTGGLRLIWSNPIEWC